MSAATPPIHPAYAPIQPDVAATSSISRSMGLCASIVTNHPDVLQLAEIFQCHAPAMRYVRSPTTCRPRPRARLSAGAPKLRTVGTALATVLTLEAMSSRQSGACCEIAGVRVIDGWE